MNVTSQASLRPMTHGPMTAVCVLESRFSKPYKSIREATGNMIL